MPSAGNGPQPKISAGESGTSSATPTQVTAAGSAMLPVPRITAASELKSQTSTAPANTQFEYVSAASSEAPLPPSTRYSQRPPPSTPIMNAPPKASAITSACSASASA